MTPEYFSLLLFGFSYGLGALSVIVSWFQLPDEEKNVWSFVLAITIASIWLIFLLGWIIKESAEVLWSAAKCFGRLVRRAFMVPAQWVRKVHRVYYDFPMNWQPFGWKHHEMTYAYWTGVKLCGKPVKAG